jgi:hypothetical protein
VLRRQSYGLEDQQVQRPLRQFYTFVSHIVFPFHFYNKEYSCLCRSARENDRGPGGRRAAGKSARLTEKSCLSMDTAVEITPPRGIANFKD